MIAYRYRKFNLSFCCLAILDFCQKIWYSYSSITIANTGLLWSNPFYYLLIEYILAASCESTEKVVPDRVMLSISIKKYCRDFLNSLNIILSFASLNILSFLQMLKSQITESINMVGDPAPWPHFPVSLETDVKI